MNGLTQYLHSLLQSDSLQFTMTQITKMTGVSGSQLRYWERKGFIASTQAKKNQNHTFSFMMVLRIATIKYYLDNGYTLRAAANQERTHRHLGKLYHQFLDKQDFQLAENDDGPEIVIGTVDEDKKCQVYMTLKKGKPSLHLRHLA